MKATNATLYFGSQVAKLGALEVCADRAVFDRVDGVVSTYARLTFKVGGNWFDVEGVVLAGGSGACELRFATMAAVTARRLDQSIRETPKAERRAPSTPTAPRRSSAPARVRRSVIALPA
jgi:hypothetical protein